MGLLDKLKNKTEIEVMEKHPLNGLDFEDRISYINAISFFIAIDETVTTTERKIFEELIKTLNCQDIKEDLEDFLNEPNIDEFDYIFNFIKEKDLLVNYLMDIFYTLPEDLKLNNNEKELLELLIKDTDLIFNDIELLLEHIRATKKNNYEDKQKTLVDLLGNKYFYNKVNDILAYYRVDNTTLVKQLKSTLPEIKLSRKDKDYEIFDATMLFQDSVVNFNKDIIDTYIYIYFIPIEINSIKNLQINIQYYNNKNEIEIFSPNIEMEEGYKYNHSIPFNYGLKSGGVMNIYIQNLFYGQINF